jgi:uncharacterized Tic20 family protein
MGIVGLLLILAVVFFIIGHPLLALVCLVLAIAFAVPGGAYSRRGWY